jgi:hypothetical protein
MRSLYKNILLITLLLFITQSLSYATIRYVSKTGSSTPPYTTWETASDSIQKAIDASLAGDTVIVANGIYKESLIIEKSLVLLGSSMDSCIIDGRGLNIFTILCRSNLLISGFNIFGKSSENDVNIQAIVVEDYHNLNMNNCSISFAHKGIHLSRSSGILENVVIKDARVGIMTFCSSIDTCKPILKNSVIIIHKDGENAWYSSIRGRPTITNNIFVTDGFNIQRAPDGINHQWPNLVLKNNLISGFRHNNFVRGYPIEIINNVFSDQGRNTLNTGYLERIQIDAKIRNNIFINNGNVINATAQPDIDYNIFWNNSGYNINSPYQLGQNDIIADPMFVKDTLGFTFNADYHLQMFSPAIDAGDPDILDVDGSRSDIGMFGGPLGEKYTYLDLAPRPPRDITGMYDNNNLVKLSWRRNSEADFSHYTIYRDTVSGFTIDSNKIIGISADSLYYDQLPETNIQKKYYYKITSKDSSGNQSAPGEEVVVVITGMNEHPPVVVEEHKLLQNYPNPFNPSTVISYRLKEGGYVKVMVYTITGELLRVLVNNWQEKGYYEVDFKPTSGERDMSKSPLKELPTFYGTDIASGIYLYRIEVLNGNRIPVYMDMKKMILLK